jgi:hypothetical protein
MYSLPQVLSELQELAGYEEGRRRPELLAKLGHGRAATARERRRAHRKAEALSIISSYPNWGLLPGFSAAQPN